MIKYIYQNMTACKSYELCGYWDMLKNVMPYGHTCMRDHFKVKSQSAGASHSGLWSLGEINGGQREE